MDKPGPSGTAARPIRFVFTRLPGSPGWPGDSITSTLQRTGADIVCLGGDQNAAAAVKAAIEEDAHGIIAASHSDDLLSHCRQLKTLLEEHGANHITVLGSTDQLRIPVELQVLRRLGVTVIRTQDIRHGPTFSALVDGLLETCELDLSSRPPSLEEIATGQRAAIARALTVLEVGRSGELAAALRATPHRAPVVRLRRKDGVRGPWLPDKNVLRLRPDSRRPLRIALLVVDPRRGVRNGRILTRARPFANHLRDCDLFTRCVAPRMESGQLLDALTGAIGAFRTAGYDLILIEKPSIRYGRSPSTESRNPH